MKQVVATFDTVADMKSAAVVVGRVYRTLGYWTKGDDGGALYIVEVLFAAPDEYTEHSVNGGTHLVRPVATTLNLRQCGALGDGAVNDTLAVSAAFNSRYSIQETKSATYRIVGGATAVNPKFCGLGTEETVLLFEGMGGFEGTNGITITPAGKHASSIITDCSLVIRGAHGKSCIATPRGAAIFYEHQHRYVFERVVVRGDVVDPTLFGLYDYGWDRAFDIGDSHCPVLRDVSVFGCYDIRVDPTVGNTENTAFYFSAAEGTGGVLMPVIDHCFAHYCGKAIAFGFQVSNPNIVNSQFHRCYDVLYSPNAASDSSYGVSELHMSNVNGNAQRYGVYIQKAAYINLTSVRMTRADLGFDHSDTWYGYYIEGIDELNISAYRAYTADMTGPAYTNDAIGMYICDCDYVNLTGGHLYPYLTGGMSKGLVLKDTTRGVVAGLSLASVDGLCFETASTFSPDITVSGLSVTSAVANKITYDAGVRRDYIKILGELERYAGVDASATVHSAAGSMVLQRGSDKQLKKLQLLTGTGAYTYTVQFSNTDAEEGDFFIVHAIMSAGTPTLAFKDGAGATIVTLNDTTSKRYHVEFTYGASWRCTGAYESLV
jgi:hypothetical protein